MAENTDLGAADRKKDHINLAFKSRVTADMLDARFYYEPMVSLHEADPSSIAMHFLGKTFSTPIWVSSMTGGTSAAATINKNLAKACGEFGMGMGLGSCRQLLFSDDYLADFQVRKYMGSQPLYANLGIAQLETLADLHQWDKIDTLLDKLEADGLIVHVNPLQEWLQPEGDRFKYAPLDTIKRLLDKAGYKIIVKEVGQGMGPESLRALLELPIEAVDFGASGGTNFALLELFRSSQAITENYQKLAHVGHSAEEMVTFVNDIFLGQPNKMVCNQVIISGGIADFLDGYFLMQKLKVPSIYGQASGLLKHAQQSYELLQQHLDLQIKGLILAKAFLKVKQDGI
ncbi:MAG: type 2 isopentenyl-diphosphate Delta-isomerase [Saprospiraceae bacterium]|nr:type 2 isopentenyl-diphosphate Delta-isomerase [Saprospiraceae bacterium]MBK8668451.1 type 2 isopentenyl-diphosphate Delta-isomerase [Saprospiraceae bacterium]MBL0098780.1 type 2 isopentenyl-diphosphate Delta-isomerase [Saprospiraceae bacterium]